MTFDPETLDAPPENRIRGALLALVVIPAGITLWLVIWNAGFIASIVGLLVAVCAIWLYRRGSGGRIGSWGALIASGITVVTLGLALFSGIVSDALSAVSGQTAYGWAELLTMSGFWEYFIESLPSAMGDYATTIFTSIGFGVLGSFGALRGAFREGRSAALTPAAPVDWFTLAPSVEPETPESPERDGRSGLVPPA